jgi:hypothetical protein
LKEKLTNEIDVIKMTQKIFGQNTGASVDLGLGFEFFPSTSNFLLVNLVTFVAPVSPVLTPLNKLN